MATVDQSSVGLLVPGWRKAKDGRLMAVPVIIADCEDPAYAGLTVSEAAERAGVDHGRASDQLRAGVLPQRGRVGGPTGPRSPRVVAWRQKYLPRELWAAPHDEVAQALGVSPSTLRRYERLGRPLGRDLRKERLPGVRAQRWLDRHVPDQVRRLSWREVAAHYEVSKATLCGWVRRDVPPRVGGYRKGPRPKTQTQRIRDELVRTLRAARQSPLHVVMGVR